MDSNATTGYMRHHQPKDSDPGFDEMPTGNQQQFNVIQINEMHPAVVRSYHDPSLGGEINQNFPSLDMEASISKEASL